LKTFGESAEESETENFDSTPEIFEPRTQEERELDRLMQEELLETHNMIESSMIRDNFHVLSTTSQPQQVQVGNVDTHEAIDVTNSSSLVINKSINGKI